MKLLIVESPAKAKKIAGYLGAGWKVEACMGHIRDLPETELGVELGQDFRPTYKVLAGKGNLVKRLLKAIKEAEAIYLATDPDREGEAIAWHILDLARPPKNKPVYRASFNAITESAVKAAVAVPRTIDRPLVEAQQARRIVDRLVGYLVSPLACKALDGKLSAGRVQSVCLRLVVEREREIAAFITETYWTLALELEAGSETFNAKLHTLKNAKVTFKSRDQLDQLDKLMTNAQFWVEKAGQTIKTRDPLPPFTTSSLQQAAAKGLGLSPERTMEVAQRLYEAGLITYMRTDGVGVATEAQTAARELIERKYGTAYLPSEPPTYTTKAANAQEAHEAIRPTDVNRLPDEELDGDGAGLYGLIWDRFVASQMAAARYRVVGAVILAGAKREQPYPLEFRSQGRVPIFDGFLRVYEEPVDDGEEVDDDEGGALPALQEGQSLKLVETLPNEHQTHSPARYTEAALVKALEQRGIGRPSTYAGMVSTIKSKGYAKIGQKRLVPTEKGWALCDFVTQRFPDVFDYSYTSQLEGQLDAVAAGQLTQLELLKAFWQGFQPQLAAAAELALQQLRPQEAPKRTGESCPQCGSDLVERTGSKGKFIGCSRFPKCTYTQGVEHKPVTLRPAEG
ncbi:MAG: type I DNA topoisomerase [Anaerolineae bacterium]|nr:type I DNA topoisomerase [Anaerolineae bacterium]